jgi:hypothetical protein
MWMCTITSRTVLLLPPTHTTTTTHRHTGAPFAHACTHDGLHLSPLSQLARIRLAGRLLWPTDCSEIRGQLAMLMGGRAAEALTCAALSTGAVDDIRRATELAHRAVAVSALGDWQACAQAGQDIARWGRPAP